MLLRLGELTRDEVHDCAGAAVAVLPIGSVEQHGPHLPLLTDTLLVEAVLQHAAPSLERSDTPFVLAPTLPVGSSEHHLFAAAYSVSPTTLIQVLADLTNSLITSGFHRLCIVNGHGGNDDCIKLAVKDLVVRQPVAAAACSYWDLGWQDRQPASTTPGHAGVFETSLMLAAHPTLVRSDRLTAPSPEPEPLFNQHEVPGLCAQAAGEWRRVDGVTDAAAEASSDRGADLLDQFADGLVRALTWFDENTRGFAVRVDPQTNHRKDHGT